MLPRWSSAAPQTRSTADPMPGTPGPRPLGLSLRGSGLLALRLAPAPLAPSGLKHSSAQPVRRSERECRGGWLSELWAHAPGRQEPDTAAQCVFPKAAEVGSSATPPACHRTGVQAPSASAPPTPATQLPKQAQLCFLPLLLPGSDPSGPSFLPSPAAPMLESLRAGPGHLP